MAKIFTDKVVFIVYMRKINEFLYLINMNSQIKKL